MAHSDQDISCVRESQSRKDASGGEDHFIDLLESLSTSKKGYRLGKDKSVARKGRVIPDTGSILH